MKTVPIAAIFKIEILLLLVESKSPFLTPPLTLLFPVCVSHN